MCSARCCAHSLHLAAGWLNAGETASTTAFKCLGSCHNIRLHCALHNHDEMLMIFGQFLWRELIDRLPPSLNGRPALGRTETSFVEFNAK